ncbi:MAG: alpha/beta hydrolase [Lysobacter sp.]|nr:alpha/beta hydrolase [Lysobacter sp.]
MALSSRTAWVANGIAGALLLLFALALWRDPGLAIRGEFAKQRIRLGAESHSLVVGDHRWVYAELPADRPDAPTLVLLHGYTGSKENWYRVATALRGRYRIVMPDLPGWGESQRREDADYGYLAQTPRVAAFLQAPQIGGGKPVALAGHSMGGGIAALLAADYPALVSQVALVNAAGVPFAPNTFAREVLAGRNPFALSDEASLERYLSTLFHVRETRPWLPWPATSLYIAQRRRDAAFEERVLTRIGRDEERFEPGKRAVKIEQPTLLLWCRHDQVIPASAMGLYAERIRHASQVMLEDCGHMSLMERPRETADAIAWNIARGVPALPPAVPGEDE